MLSWRRTSLATVFTVSCALVAVGTFPPPASAGQGPPGNCETKPGSSASSDYCSYFQADQGPPGLEPTFWMQCPATGSQNGTPVVADHVNPIVYVWNLGPDATVPVTPVGHLNDGEGGFYNPGAGATAWYNDLEVPVLPGYPAVLNGWGYCVLYNQAESIGFVESVPLSYFYVTPPDVQSYVFEPKDYLLLSWSAVFGGARLLGGEAFRAPALTAQLLSGRPDTTTTTTPQPDTTTTTRPSPTTTTSTTRGRGS